MDINDLRGISTLMLFIGFVGMCFWAYNSKRKTAFDEAANLPFADEELNQRSMQEDASNG